MVLAPLFLAAWAVIAAPGANPSRAAGTSPGAPRAASDPEVASGIALLERLEYDRAVVVLGRALTRADLSPRDRVAGLEALAFAYTILDDRVHADETFCALLDVSPGYTVAASRSPRLRDAFARAKETWEAGRRVDFTLDPAALDVAGTLSGDPRRLGAVMTKTDEGATAPLRCEGTTCRGDRPPERFRVELLDHGGTLLATAGPYEGSGAREGLLPWWAWVAIGVGAVGMGAVVVAAASPGDPPAGTLGVIQLP